MNAAVQAPVIDYGALSFLFALGGGSVLVLLAGLLPGRFNQSVLTPGLAVIALLAAADLTVRQWGEPSTVLEGALRIDDLALAFNLLICASALATVVLAWRSRSVDEVGRGEFYGLLLASATGMAIVTSSQNFVSLFVGFELFSITLYVLCASDLWRRRSIESGLKYLIVGSIGSATLLYGISLIYGATGSTDFAVIAHAIENRSIAGDPLLLGGIALLLVGLAFKLSIAPFHQWAPDVYEGASTPVTAFMAVATKAAAFAIVLRVFGDALPGARDDWAPMLAVLAVASIVVGNVGALGQQSLKRMLAYSGVAQAGYIMVGVVVGSALGARAVMFYLAAYLAMNIGAFAVIVARERAGLDDSHRSLVGLGREAPVLAWCMTICMISLAGLPVTAGFIGKIYLVQAAVEGSYTWLAVAIVLGSAVSLAYYLRVVATMWMRPDGEWWPLRQAIGSAPVGAAIGGAPQADGRAYLELLIVAVVAAAATVVFGFFPDPLLDLARDAGETFSGF